MLLSAHKPGTARKFLPAVVDVLFRSVAAVFAGNALGVILTGMGQDGLRGCEALCAAGAPIVVQDEASSIVSGDARLCGSRRTGGKNPATRSNWA